MDENLYVLETEDGGAAQIVADVDAGWRGWTFYVHELTPKIADAILRIARDGALTVRFANPS